jgi:hypothetical protein
MVKLPVPQCTANALPLAEVERCESDVANLPRPNNLILNTQ